MKDGSWPGQTLHTKLALFDESVFLLGSNNMSQQSLERNSELMTLVNDPLLSSQMAQIFNQAINPTPSTESSQCGDKVFDRPARTQLIDLAELENLRISYPIGKETFKYGIGH